VATAARPIGRVITPLLLRYFALAEGEREAGAARGHVHDSGDPSGDAAVRRQDVEERGVGGGSALDPEVVKQLLAPSEVDDTLADLTPREREVLALMAEGKTNAAIAKQLWLTERTVETHVSSILGKLGLSHSRRRPPSRPRRPRLSARFSRLGTGVRNRRSDPARSRQVDGSAIEVGCGGVVEEGITLTTLLPHRLCRVLADRSRSQPVRG
jgi:DNA-binding CsgD family transcriptional regulator